MTTTPNYLQPGDTIGLVCPAGFMEYSKIETCIQTLEQWGYKVKTGKTIGGDGTSYFSGSDKERTQDLQEMLDDDQVRAILCARGGYGTARIIEKLDFSAFRMQPKWIIGFSDVTVLLTHVYRNLKIAGMHAPMAAAFIDGGNESPSVLSLRHALEGKKTRYELATHPFNRKGEAIGELVGGNLSLITHLMGTSSEIKTRGRILFIEEVDEYLYKVDRMMIQLKRSGKLDSLAGLIIGGFTGMKDTRLPFGQHVYELIAEKVKEYDYPACFHFPVGHQPNNYCLKVGVGYKLRVAKTKVILEE